jgi:hypothetical protein
MGAAAAHGAHATAAAPATSAAAGVDGLAVHILRRAPQAAFATRRASCSESDDAEVVACELDLVDSAAWEPTELLPPPPPPPPRQVMAAVEAAQQLATDGVGERGDGDSKGGWTPDSRLSNGQMSSLDAQVR